MVRIYKIPSNITLKERYRSEEFMINGTREDKCFQ